jgi:opacity protein-like surface antigen
MDGAGISNLFHLKHSMNITLGPAFYYTDLGDVKGIEHPYSNLGNFQTLNYRLSAQSFSLLLESRAIFAAHRIQPFVIADIGAAWNHLQRYNEVPTDPNSSATANPNVFRNNTQTNFAFEVGLGAQTQIYNDKKHHVSYSAALSYRYFNFGQGALAQSTIQTSNQTLKINTLDTQAVLLSLSADFA